MAVVKNLMVRVGANTSSFVEGMKKASEGTKDFGTMVQSAMGGQVAESLRAFDAEIVTDKIKATKKELKAMMKEKDNMALTGIGADDSSYQELVANIQAVRAELAGLFEEKAALQAVPLGNTGENAALEAMVSHVRELEEAAAATGNAFEKLSIIKEIGNAGQTITGMLSGGDASLPIGQQLNEAKAALKELENAGMGAGDAAWDDMYVKVQNLTEAVKEYKANLKSIPTSVWSKMGSSAKSAFSKISTAASGVKKVLTTVGSGVKKVGGFLGKIGGAGISGIKKVAGWIGSIGHRARSSSGGVNSLSGVLKKVGVAALGLKLASAMFGRLRSIVSSYISENSTLQAQVDTLKNSMGQALAPAINLVANALSAVMPYIIGVSNAIGSLVANIFGSGWTTVASGAKAAASATSGAAAAQEKYNRTLAGFDEITKLDSSSSSGGGGGGGGGSSDVTTTTISGVLPDWLTSFAQKIKDAIAADDFTGVGEIIADQLGAAVDHALSLINSAEFRQKILGVVSAVTAGINGFFAELTASSDEKNSIAENIGTLIGDAVTFALATIDRFFTSVDFGNIGTAIAQGINGAVESMNSSSFSFGSVLGDMLQSGIDGAKGIIDTLDWAGIGSLISKNVNNFVTSVDWAGAGKTFSDGIRGVLNTITTAIQEIDWYQMGESIKDFIVNIDWNGVVSDLATAFGAACGGLGALIGGLIGDAIEDAKTYFQDKIEEAGGNVVEGIWNGIVDAMKSFGTWCVENIFDPMIEGFKSTFKIHSPSKDESILEIGKNILEGLLNGMLEPIRAIGSWLKSNIYDPIVNGFKSLFGDGFLSGLFGDDTLDGVIPNYEISVTGLKDEIPDADKRIEGVVAVLGEMEDRDTKGRTMNIMAKINSYTDNTDPNKTTPATMKATAFMDFTRPTKTTEVTEEGTSFRDATSKSSNIVDVTAAGTRFANKLTGKTTIPVEGQVTSVDDSQIYSASSAVRTGVSVAVSLTRKGWTAISTFVGNLVTVNVKLSKNGWTSISGFVGTKATVSVLLSKSGWTTIASYVGTAVKTNVSLAKSGWSSIATFVGSAVSVSVSLKKGWTGTVKSLLGITDPTVYLNVKAPTISINWATFTAYGKKSLYPKSFSVNWYAQGGIIEDLALLGWTGNTAHVAGEAGREAILPLDRNTWWMDKIAQRVADRVRGGNGDGDTRPIEITVQVPLDGKIIGQSVVRWANGQARATGTHPMAAYI